MSYNNDTNLTFFKTVVIFLLQASEINYHRPITHDTIRELTSGRVRSHNEINSTVAIVATPTRNTKPIWYNTLVNIIKH